MRSHSLLSAQGDSSGSPDDGMGRRFPGGPPRQDVGSSAPAASGRRWIARLRGFGSASSRSRVGGATPGADASYGPEQLDRCSPIATSSFSRCRSTPKTQGIIGARELELLGPHGWLVNVGAGSSWTPPRSSPRSNAAHRRACLDVVDPEPLSAGDPALVVPERPDPPHVANPWEQHYEPYARRVAENVARFRQDAPASRRRRLGEEL